MSYYIDRKYLSFVSPRLSKFVQKSDSLWNFRCPHCGDSNKNKLKARGYIYRRGDNLFFMCHNCGSSTSFGNFLKSLDRSLFDQYRLETYTDKHGEPVSSDEVMRSSKPDFKVSEEKPIINLPNVKSLSEEHIAKKFLRKRLIPQRFMDYFYYADNFKVFVDEIAPSDHSDELIADARLIIPYYDQTGRLLGFQGRALTNSKVRYITIKLFTNASKMFGLERVDTTKTIYVLEGPIDSLFFDNAVATMDPQLIRTIPVLGGNLDYVFVYDNEPHNAQICNFMDKTIAMGYKVCVWPDDVKEKDVNDMILAGKTAQEVNYIIDLNTFEDLRARLEFSRWKRA